MKTLALFLKKLCGSAKKVRHINAALFCLVLLVGGIAIGNIFAPLFIHHEAWAAVLSNIVGSGTVNQVAAFNTDSTTIGDSIIYDNGSGNVGIGTMQPETRLELKNSNDGMLKLNRDGATPTFFNVGADGAMVIKNSGIDTLTLKGGDLTIAGKTKFGGVAYGWPGTAGGNGQVLTTNGSGSLSWNSQPEPAASLWQQDAGGVVYYNNGNVGIGTTHPVAWSHPGRAMHIHDTNSVSWHLSTDSGLEGGAYLGSVSGNVAAKFGPGLYMGTLTTPFKLFTTGDMDLIAGDNIQISLSSNRGGVAIGMNGEWYPLWVDHRPASGDLYVGHSLAVSGGINALGSICGISNSQCVSDIRLKTNLEPLTDVLDKIQDIRATRFDWNSEAIKLQVGKAGERQIGMIAQDMEKVFPELVFTNTNGYKGLKYEQFTAVLLEAVKEQQQEIKDLTHRIEALEARQSK